MADHQFVIRIARVRLGGEFRRHVHHALQMVIKGHHIRIAAKGERVRCMEDIVVALAEHVCNRLRPSIPDLFPVVFAGYAHVVLMASG